MSEYFVTMRCTSTGAPPTDRLFDQVADELFEHFSHLDADLSMSTDPSFLEFTMFIEADTPEQAFDESRAVVRTVLHGCGHSTPADGGWEVAVPHSAKPVLVS